MRAARARKLDARVRLPPAATVSRGLFLWASIIGAQLAVVVPAAAIPDRSRAPGAASRLRVEYMAAPLGVDVAYPLRFSWAGRHAERGQGQTSYQLVARFDICGKNGRRGVSVGSQVQRTI